MNLLDLVGKGVVATSLDVDNALYTTKMSGTVEPKQQNSFILWAHVLEFGARIALLAISLYLFSGDEALFTVGGVKFTAAAIAMLVAGVFLLATNIKELGNFLLGRNQEDGEERPKEKQSFNRVLIETTIVNTILSIDTVVAVADMTDALAGMAVIMAVTGLIRLVFIRQIAGFMRAHPEASIVTSGFLILIGLSLVFQAINEDFPDVAFGVGLAIAFGLLLLYRARGSAYFRKMAGESEESDSKQDSARR